MNRFAKLLTEDRRATILQALLASGAYTAGESVLDVFLSSCGYKLSADQLRTELAWLAEQGLITIRTIEQADMQIATLTRRGQDVAEGRAVVPGVKRPSAL